MIENENATGHFTCPSEEPGYNYVFLIRPIDMERLHVLRDKTKEKSTGLLGILENGFSAKQHAYMKTLPHKKVVSAGTYVEHKDGRILQLEGTRIPYDFTADMRKNFPYYGKDTSTRKTVMIDINDVEILPTLK